MLTLEGAAVPVSEAKPKMGNGTGMGGRGWGGRGTTGGMKLGAAPGPKDVKGGTIWAAPGPASIAVATTALAKRAMTGRRRRVMVGLLR
jgi:hypothetical protein